MKKIAREIDVIVENLINASSFKLLAKQKLELLEKLDSTFLEFTVEDKFLDFEIVLNKIVLSKISKRIISLRSELPPSHLIENGCLISKEIMVLESLRTDLYEAYESLVKGSSQARKIIDDEIKKDNNIRDFLINPLLSVEGYLDIGEIKPENFRIIVDKGYNESIKFIENSFEDNNTRKRSEEQLLSLIKKVNDKIISLDKIIPKLEDEIKNINGRKIKERFSTISLKNGEKEVVDNFESENYDIQYQEFYLNNSIHHVKRLKDFRDYHLEIYLFLSERLNSFSPRSTDVFGKRNEDLLRSLFDEFEFFLEANVTIDNFIQVFSSVKDEPKIKINLVNGKLDDFGSIIKGMLPKFVIKRKKEYDIWWSKRFLFNNEVKDDKSVGKIRTGTLSPQHVSKIKSILSVLD